MRRMEELGKLSPVSRESSLEALPRKELQQLAKESGVKVRTHLGDCSCYTPTGIVRAPLA